MRMNTLRPVSALPPPVVSVAPAAPIDEDRGLEFGEYWRAVKERRWIILAIAAAFAVGAILYAMTLAPVFRSTATVLIEAGKSKIVSIDEVYSGVSQDREHYQSQIEILRSREVARRTVVATRLWEHPDFDPRRGGTSLLARARSLFGEPPVEVVWTDETLADATVGALLGSLTIEPVRLSQLVKVSIESHDRDLAAQLANMVAETYIEADREARFRITQQVNGWIQERLGALRDKVAQSELELQEYREKHGLVSLGGSAQSLAGQQVAEVMQRLVNAEVRRTELESAYRQVMGVKDGNYASLPAVLSNGAVDDARRRVSASELKVEEYTRLYGSEHSRLIEARAELESARRLLQRQTLSVTEAAKREYQAARNTENQLRAALGNARDAVQDLNRQEFQLGILEREVQANRQLYEVFVSRSKETNLGGDLQAAVARVVDPATANEGPVRPDRKKLVLAFLAVGLFLGVGGAVTLDRLDRSLKRPADIERRLRQPVLASLPLLDKASSANASRLFLDQPASIHAEAIRTARTGVLLSSLDVHRKLLLVTSAENGVGKTTVCTNLALAHAQTKTTLLIDADLRHPEIGRRLGLPDDAKGLTDLIGGKADVKDCIHRVPGSPLLVMPAGSASPNPIELLLSQRFREALLSLSQQVEMILIDSPPVDSVTDALVIGSMASSTILVVKASQTQEPKAQQALVRLQRAGASILGVVMNAVPEDRMSDDYLGVAGAWQPMQGGSGGAIATMRG